MVAQSMSRKCAGTQSKNLNKSATDVDGIKYLKQVKLCITLHSYASFLKLI